MNYKVGDKVRIKNRRGANWNPEGEMDHWMGEVMTLRKKHYNGLWSMEEDKLEYCGGWYWEEDDFEPVEQLLSADEVWKWLGEHYHDGAYTKVFGKEYQWDDINDKFTFTEITEKVSSYVNEQKKPKGLNMDIVCIKSKSGHFTDGKKYEVRDGYFITDNGVKLGKGACNEQPYKTLDEIEEELASKFIELVEE